MSEPDDTCRPVEIDGEIIRVRGSSDMSDESRAALAEVIRAAKRKFAAEHPARLTVDTITSDQLDALYDRAEKAEAAIARALDVIHEWQRNGPPNDYLTRVHRALNPPVSGNSSAALDELSPVTPPVVHSTTEQQASALPGVDELAAAQAALVRVRKLASRWAILRAYGSAATELRAALAESKEPTS